MPQNFYFIRTNIFVMLFFILISPAAFSQLSSFSLTVNATAETCTGNGSLTFTTNDTSAGATIVYAIYLLPNTTTPFATQSGNVLTGLAHGNYRVIATQTVGNENNSQQQDVSISNAIQSLVYGITGTVHCNDGIISVNVTQGTAVNYEILSGPVIRPLQTSNIFTLLPAGEYVIRVYDVCGDAVVQTFTLLNPPGGIGVSNISVPECALINCNTIKIKGTLLANPSLNFPVQVVYTIFPPSGIPIVLNQTINASSADLPNFSIGIPFFNNQASTVNVTVTDACGNIGTSNGNIIQESLSVSVTAPTDLCVNYIKINGCNYVMPVTVNFLSAPAGFNPAAYNNAHPGPFGQFPIQYLSTPTNAMPDGNYVVQITDGCGRTAQNQVSLQSIIQEPNYTVLPGGCGSGQIGSPGQNGTNVATVIINSAPAALNHALPWDVSFNIADGHFLMADLPSGTYEITIISVCGITYNYTVVIPPSQQQPVFIDYLRGCGDGFGSVKLSVQATTLSVVRIVSAPATYTQNLPYDVSFDIFQGAFSMNGLPEGIYSFYLKDECGGERTITIDIPGYHTLVNSIVVDENCGSFNLALDYESNEPSFHYYWLQRLNPITNQWEHPYTGFVYAPGAIPNTANAYVLGNGTNNLNIVASGTFRILKLNFIFDNGTAAMAPCIVDVKDFEINAGPKIITAYNLPCATNSGQVLVVAQGIAPLTYFITTKDGQPFQVNNGTSNVFSNLVPGTYNFQVRDVCGNIVNRLFDFGSVPFPAIAQSILCDGQNGQLSVANFNFLSYQWWQGNNTGTILSTTNTLNFIPFSAAADAGIYHVRVYSTQLGLCTDQIISYTIPPSGVPNAGFGTTSDICGSSGTIDLFSLLTGTFNTGGAWSELTNSGMQIGHSWLPVGIPFGSYQFQYHVDGLCSTSADEIVTIHFNPIPLAPSVSVSPLLACSSSDIILSASAIPNATYHWNGPNGFNSNEQNPTVYNASVAASGMYSVTASIGSCISPEASISVTVNPSTEFNLVAGCNGNAYLISAIPVDNLVTPNQVTYSWSGPQNFISHDNPVDISGGEQGTYTLTVTSENGCSTTSEIAVLNTLCAIPTGISPNGDGNNDTFDLTGFEVLKFKIYNRYGRMVFDQDDYTNQWHGQDFNGRDLPDATYFYYLKTKTGDERTGWVYVTKY